MITGDYQHTALGTARDVGMISAAAPILIIDKDPGPRPAPTPGLRPEPSNHAPPASVSLSGHGPAVGQDPGQGRPPGVDLRRGSLHGMPVHASVGQDQLMDSLASGREVSGVTRQTAPLSAPRTAAWHHGTPRSAQTSPHAQQVHSALQSPPGAEMSAPTQSMLGMCLMPAPAEYRHTLPLLSASALPSSSLPRPGVSTALHTSAVSSSPQPLLSASASRLSPQPLPPTSALQISPQPLPPTSALQISPQPLPSTSAALHSPRRLPSTTAPNSPWPPSPTCVALHSPQPLPSTSASPSSPSDSTTQVQSAAEPIPSTSYSTDPSVDTSSLSFILRVGGQGTRLTPHQAWTALAEGQTQCVVTGLAFQHLLEQSDSARLETVLRSVVVFARMQPHQKGQAVLLLTSQGLTHPYQGGATRHTPVWSRSLLLAAHLLLSPSCLPAVAISPCDLPASCSAWHLPLTSLECTLHCSG